MAATFEFSGRIARPVEEVYEAVADPQHLSRYFTTGGAQGRAETGATVTWSFHDFPGSFPVSILEAESPRRIVLRWEAADSATHPDGPYETTTTLSFEGLEDGRTLVRIAEQGFRDDASSVHASYGNCSGWMQMLCAMKAYLEHGVNLREGMFA
ncbi:MAG: SRPBCC domain-containing protein [Acidobacteriota bacterium]